MSKKPRKKQKSNAVSAKYSKKNKLSAKKTHEINQAIQLAGQYHQAGDFQQAENIYQQVLAIEPDNVDANHLLGLIAMQAGNNTVAVQLIKKAIQSNPSFAAAHNNLGSALKELGRLDEAIASYKQALIHKPDYAEAYNNLASVQIDQGKLDEAIASCKQALAFRPDYAEAYNNLGSALKELGRLDEAITSFRQALVLKPDFAGVYYNLGLAYQEQALPEEAIECYKQTLLLKPDYYEAHNNIGNVLIGLGLLDEAIECFEKAFSLNRDFALAHYNYSFALLLTGRYEQGWKEFEWRYQTKGKTQTRFNEIPRWQGEDLGEHTLLVYAEEGIGDVIRYASCMPGIIPKAQHVVIECDPRLQSLFQRSFPEATVVGTIRDDTTWMETAPSIDIQVPITSLPLYTRTQLEDFPKESGYLKADPERAAYWKAQLDALGPGLKVGVSWRSSKRSMDRDRQYADFKKDWGTILAIPGIQFVNLQYDECSEELEWARNEWGVEIHDFEELDQLNDMEGVAGLLSALDLTITGVSAVFALGGALNVPVWLMIVAYHVASLGTDHLPWFPAIRCFLKEPADEWGQVTEKLAQALPALIK